MLRSVLWVYLTAINYLLQEGNKSKINRNFKCYVIGTEFCEQCVFGPSLWPHNSHPRLVVTAAREVWADSKLNRIIVGLLLHCRSRPLRSWAYYSDMSIRCNVYSVPHEKCQCHSWNATLPLCLWAFVTAAEQINYVHRAEAPHYKSMWETGGAAPLILNLGIGWRWGMSFTLLQLYCKCLLNRIWAIPTAFLEVCCKEIHFAVAGKRTTIPRAPIP